MQTIRMKDNSATGLAEYILLAALVIAIVMMFGTRSEMRQHDDPNFIKDRINGRDPTGNHQFPF